MEAERRRVRPRTAYVDGNTVRRLEAAPDYRREQLRRQREEEKRREELRQSRKRAAIRNQEKALLFNRGYAVFLAVAVLIIAMSSAYYIKLQSDITARMKQISSMESELESIKTDNAAAQKRINTATDLNHIKDVAINQLGMVYASEDQIVYYSVDNEDYMNQYQDIPAK